MMRFFVFICTASILGGCAATSSDDLPQADTNFFIEGTEPLGENVILETNSNESEENDFPVFAPTLNDTELENPWIGVEKCQYAIWLIGLNGPFSHIVNINRVMTNIASLSLGSEQTDSSLALFENVLLNLGAGMGTEMMGQSVPEEQGLSSSLFLEPAESSTFSLRIRAIRHDGVPIYIETQRPVSFDITPPEPLPAEFTMDEKFALVFDVSRWFADIPLKFLPGPAIYFDDSENSDMVTQFLANFGQSIRIFVNEQGQCIPGLSDNGL